MNLSPPDSPSVEFSRQRYQGPPDSSVYGILQCMKVKSESEVTQLCPTLSDPMDCSLPGSFIHGISQARVLEWVAIAFSSIKLVGENLMRNVVKSIGM